MSLTPGNDSRISTTNPITDPPLFEAYSCGLKICRVKAMKYDADLSATDFVVLQGGRAMASIW